MRRLHMFVNGLRNLVRGSTLDHQMDDEVRFHLECRVHDLIEAGASPEDAQRRARLEFGPIEAYKERTRDARRPRVLDDLVRDIAYAWRGLWRSPALIITCVLSLGLGIGVNTTIFTALRSVIRHQPTLANADRVVGVEPGNSNQFWYLNYRDLRESGIFTDVTGYRITRVNLRANGQSERLLTVATTGNFFLATGVRPQLGHLYAIDDDAPERAPRVAVLTDACWRRRFDRDASVIGRTVHLNGEPYNVVAVLPAGYKGVMPAGQPELYVPISSALVPQVGRRENVNGLTVLARLRDGETPQQGQLAVTRLGQALEQQYPHANAGLSDPAAVFPVSELVLRGVPRELTIIPVALLVLFGLVLLIACGNVAGLLLARATARHHELAIRIALGARRARLIQLLSTEALVVGVLSTAGGVVLTLLAIPLINAIAVPGAGRLLVAPDRWLIAYAAFLGGATTIACGLVPAVRSSHVDVSAALQDGGSMRTTGRMRMRHAFVIGQVALSAFLLVLSAMLMRTAARGTTIDPGFDIGSGAVVSVSLPPTRTDAQRLALAQELTTRLAAVPSVQSASIATIVPLAGDIVRRSIEIRGRPIASGAHVLVNHVGPQYFETMGIPLVHGRGFQWRDRTGSTRVAIVNEALVTRYFGDGDPLGAFIGTDNAEHAEVVGVVANTQFMSLREAPRPLVYYSYAQQPSDPVVHVRVSGPPESALHALHAAAEALDGGATIRTRTLRQAAGLEIAVRRAAAFLTAALGLLGLSLALVGLYGVMAYTVTAQQTEIGVRLALGASGASVLSLILRRGLRLVAWGSLLGISAAVIAMFVARAALVGVSPIDPIALLATAGLLLAAGLCASYLPALRATRIEPRSGRA